jgi:hypothetical protein
MIRTPEKVEQCLNADLPGCFAPDSPRLWHAMNDRLSYFRERPDFRFVVFSSGLSGSLPLDPELVERTLTALLDHLTLTDVQLAALQAFERMALLWNGLQFEVHLPWKVRMLERAYVAATAMTFATRHMEIGSGQVIIALGDRGEQGALSFCGNHPDAILIPDYRFLQTLGYQEFRASVNRDWIPWSQRKPVVFWRSMANGPIFEPTDPDDWSWLPRVHLCDTAAGLAQRFPIDVKITGIPPGVREMYAEYVPSMERFYGASVAPIDFMGYRYLIDIDGWANAYAGFFQKLLTGSTVLKVASPRRYRQWYYDRLQPWEHYVPVASDLSDLESAVDFVFTNEAEAYAIGQRGREVALAMTLESEMAHMAATVAAVQGSFDPLSDCRKSIGSSGDARSGLFTAEYGTTDGTFWVLLVDPASGQPIIFGHSVVITATRKDGAVFTASAANISLEPGTYDIHVWAFLERSTGPVRQTSSELSLTLSGITID